MIPNLPLKLTWARRVTWLSFVLFFVSLLGFGYAGGTPASLLAIISVPLLLLLPGMIRENYKSLAMLSFVTLLYFIPLVVDVMAPESSLTSVVSLTLICILFVASMLFSRWKQYDVKQPARA